MDKGSSCIIYGNNLVHKWLICVILEEELVFSLSMDAKCSNFGPLKYNWSYHVLQVGGLEEAYLAAKRLFLSMGKNTIYCGGAGNGSVRSLM